MTDATARTEGDVQPSRRRLTRAEARATTRKRLLASAAEVFAEKGFASAALADVAERAGYTIGAVYSNFATKDELFHALMRERLAAVEASLAQASQQDEAARQPSSTEDVVEAELERMARSEDAVPSGWWRLLAEFRSYADTNPSARAELRESELRCRTLMAAHIDRFAAKAGIELPLPAADLADLTWAISDGLRAAHAQGRLSMTPGEGLRRVVGAMIAGAARR